MIKNNKDASSFFSTIKLQLAKEVVMINSNTNKKIA